MPAIGWSTSYEIWDGSAYAPLSGVFRINPPTHKASRVDITTLCDFRDLRRYGRTRIEAGEPSFEMNYSPNSADDLLLMGLLNSGAAARHRIVLPEVPGIDGRRAASFEAIVSGYETGIPLDDRLTALVSIIPASSLVSWGDVLGPMSLILQPGIVEDGIVQ